MAMVLPIACWFGMEDGRPGHLAQYLVEWQMTDGRLEIGGHAGGTSGAAEAWITGIQAYSTRGETHNRLRNSVYNKTSMRAFSTSIMALLVVAALFWGNCFSCPQLLLAAQKHGCCPHTKRTTSECQTQGLKNFVKAEKSAPAAPAPATMAVLEPGQMSAQIPESVPDPQITDHAPHEILSLRI